MSNRIVASPTHPTLDPAVIAQAEAHLRAVDDPTAQLIDRVGPCMLAPQTDLFAELLRAIIAQQISTKAQAAITARIVGYYAPAPITPQAILATPDADLRALGCSRAKVIYLKDLSARIVAGTLDLDRLPALPDDEIITELVAVKGIGRWTAEMLLIFALGRPDVWPIDDLGIVLGVQQVYALPERPKREDLATIGERWRPFRTVMSWYLWRSR
jgi:DNA-3-methyladenine glycosylase II